MKTHTKKSYKTCNSRKCSKKKQQQRRGFIVVSALRVLGVLSLAPVAGVLLWSSYANQYVSPRVHLGATMVGGMTQEEVQPIVEQEIEKVRQLEFVISDDEGFERVTLEELGVEVNKHKTISRLFAANKSFWPSFDEDPNTDENLAKSYNQLRAAAPENNNVDIILPHADIETSQLRNSLKERLLKREREAKNAELIWSAEQGWEIASDGEGRRVKDIESTLDRLVSEVTQGLADPDNEQSYYVEYSAIKPEVQSTDLQAVLQKSQTLTQKPVHVHVFNRVEPVNIPAEAQKWVTIQGQDVSINMQQVQSYAQFLAQNNNVEASNMTLTGIEHNPSEYYGGGNYKKAIVDGNLSAGQKLNESKLIEDFIAALQNTESEEKKVEAVFDVIEPKIISEIEGYEFPQIISRGVSDYHLGNSANRVHNIHHALGIQSFTIVDPGEEFSFNKVGGWVTLEKGYQNGKVIFGTGIGIAPGGGVCQVSTTMFRAAVNAGFPVTQRKPHSWDVSYYRDVYGVDAAVYPPSKVDLKFVNDSPGPILIHGYADAPNEIAYFDFYGTSDGRSVILEQTANYRWGTGRVVKNDWIIQRDNGEIDRREIISSYSR